MRKGKEIKISKSVMPSLPSDYQETKLGESQGSMKQYRGKAGMHAREYQNVFEIHQDRFDPRKHPLSHLVVDSPETIFSLASAAFLSKTESKTQGSMNLLFLFITFLSLNKIFSSLKRLIFG
jgi:hypothetical protein